MNTAAGTHALICASRGLHRAIGERKWAHAYKCADYIDQLVGEPYQLTTVTFIRKSEAK